MLGHGVEIRFGAMPHSCNHSLLSILSFLRGKDPVYTR